MAIRPGVAKRIADGICTHCPNKARAGKVNCADCAKRACERAAAAKLRYIQAGCCRDCKAPPKPGRERCEKHLKSQRDWYKNKTREASLLEKATVLHTVAAEFDPLASHPNS